MKHKRTISERRIKNGIRNPACVSLQQNNVEILSTSLGFNLTLCRCRFNIPCPSFNRLTSSQTRHLNCAISTPSSHSFHLNHVIATESFHSRHLNHVIATESSHSRHLNHVIATESSQPRHHNHVIATESSHSLHRKSIIPIAPPQPSHLERITSTASSQPYLDQVVGIGKNASTSSLAKRRGRRSVSVSISEPR